MFLLCSASDSVSELTEPGAAGQVCSVSVGDEGVVDPVLDRGEEPKIWNILMCSCLDSASMWRSILASSAQVLRSILDNL